MLDSSANQPGSSHGKVPRVTLIFGDEPLLVEESADEIRAAAAAQGCDERLVMTVEPGFDWHSLEEAALSMSLFSRRRLIDLRMPGGKPGEAGAQALIQYCDLTISDTSLLLVAGRLEGRSRQTKWFKAIEKAGRVLELKPVPANRLPVWIQARAKTRGMAMDQEAATLLAQYTEGNLLATAQEIDKLKLLTNATSALSYKDVAASITDNARYNVYSLLDHCLAGNSNKSLRVLTSLRNEGVEPAFIVWTLTQQVRTLYSLSRAIAAGQAPAEAFKSFRIWSRRAPLISQALKRLDTGACESLLRETARLDRILKGRSRGAIWTCIEQACLTLCKTPCVKVPLQ